MAIFNQSDKDTTHKAKSIISKGCSILRGEIELIADCHIDGYIEGSIFSKNNITVGQSGHVNGFILARHVIVSGQFNGHIDCHVLVIKPGGKVEGEVKTETLNIESGALFTGYSHKNNSRNFYQVLPKQVRCHLENHLENSSLTIEENESKPKQLTDTDKPTVISQ